MYMTVKGACGTGRWWKRLQIHYLKVFWDHTIRESRSVVPVIIFMLAGIDGII